MKELTMLVLQCFNEMKMKHNYLRIISGGFILISLFFLSDIAFAQEYQKTTPKTGEGVFSLLHRFNLDPKEYFDAFIELNKDKLGDDLALKTGQTYLLPLLIQEATTLKNETGVFPIFGKDYENIAFKDAKLQGAVFYIVSGHGGPDPGAIGKKSGHTLCEDEYAYDFFHFLTQYPTTGNHPSSPEIG